MKKQFKQVIQGTSEILAVAAILLLVNILRFVIYATNTWNLGLQRIGG